MELPRAVAPGLRVEMVWSTENVPREGSKSRTVTVEAFSALGPEYRLTIVGETWEGWTMPAELIAASPVADRIAFVNRYVADAEVDRYFAEADMVVLPYRRSSASGRPDRRALR